MDKKEICIFPLTGGGMLTPVDKLFVNAHILTMDEKLHQFKQGAIAITKDTITAVGEENELVNIYDAKEIIDCNGKILMPGLINAHTHVAMSLLRSLADDLRLDVWLQGYIWPVEREFVTPTFVQLGTKLGCAELIRSGVTCFADLYFYEETVAQTAADVGLRALCSQTIVKFPAPDALSFEDSISSAQSFIERWKNHELITPSIGPHAPYTCTQEILSTAAQISSQYDVPLHIHISETSHEVENMRKENGMPVVPFVKKQGLLNAKVLAAHCVHIDEGEMRTLFHSGAGVAHNPTSNLKLASGFAPIMKMLSIGLNVGIGTDGPASNNDLDMFEEIRLTAYIAKAINNDPTALPASQAMSMATRLGARALHLGTITGTLEPGKRADLILVDLSSINNAPHFDRDPDNCYSRLVYSAKSTDVKDVMVNGKWLMRNRHLLTLDEEELITEAQESAHKIDKFLIKREQSVLSKLIALGGSSEEESFEIQIKARVNDPEKIKTTLHTLNLDTIRLKHYHQHDIYFQFKDISQGWLRFREDELVDESNNIIGVRARLTLIGQSREADFANNVLLSRIRYLAPATNSLRFYREYFKPQREIIVEKDRWRWLVIYNGKEFYINLDHLENPDIGYYLEIKSSTWSRLDAEEKAIYGSELLNKFIKSLEKTETLDYVEIVDR